jgi:nucleotide-binding universal stress UspA family protein
MVGLNRTERDIGLIHYAAMIAQLGTAMEARFVHVLPAPGGPSAAPDHDSALAAIQKEVASHFLNVPDRVKVYCDVLKGPLLDRILTFITEQEVDLLLLGHRPDHPPGLGSLVRRLAMKAPCSVWVVPDGSPPSLRRILVPIDFSEPSADAMSVATSMARLCGQSEVLALHVYFNEAVVTYEEADQLIRGEEQGAYECFIRPINCQGVKVTPLFVEGANVARTIHRVAGEQGVDLKILATRGRSRSATILLGSVAEGVIIEARTPVLIVKHFGARLGLLQALLDRGFRRRTAPRFG